MKILKEILWLLIAIILSIAILFPIVDAIDYKFLYFNIFIIFLSVFYARLILDFYSITIYSIKWVRYIFFSLNLFLLVTVFSKIHKIVALFDIFTITSYSNKITVLDYTHEGKLINYINTEILLFGIICFVGIAMFNIKLIKSYWNKQDISEF